MSESVAVPKERFKLVPAVYLLLRKDEEVLLLKRANTGYQDGKYSVIAGHLDGNELGKVAMAREAKEEAGIEVKTDKMEFVHVAHRLGRNGGQERVDFFYQAWEWSGEIINREPDKCDNLSWHPIRSLPSNTLPLVRLVINDVLNGITYSEYVEEPI